MKSRFSNSRSPELWEFLSRIDGNAIFIRISSSKSRNYVIYSYA